MIMQNRYLKRCTRRITAPRPTHSSNFICRLTPLTNTFWKPAVRNGCLSVDASTKSRAPRVHYLSILAHNEKRRAFYFLLLLSFAFVWRLSEGQMNHLLIRGLVRRTIAVTWIQKLRWGLARLCLQNLSEPRLSARLSVDSALARSQVLRQIRGTHPPLHEAV